MPITHAYAWNGLKYVWRDVTDLSRLLRILSPLQHTGLRPIEYVHVLLECCYT